MVNLVSQNSNQQTQAEHMDTLDSYLEKGNDYKQKEQWEEAITCYRTLLEANPDHWQAQHHLGDCLLNLERWQEASEAYYEALKVKPDFIWAHHNLGITLVHLERWEEAYECFEKVREQNPDFWDVDNVKYSAHLQCKVGDYLFKQQRWEEAVAVYRRVIALNRDLTLVHINLGRALQELGLSAWEKVIKTNSGSAWKYDYLTEAKEKVEQLLDYKEKVLGASGRYTAVDATYNLWLQENFPKAEDLKRMAETSKTFTYKPVISIIVPVYNTPESFLREMIQSVLDQVYPYWELCLADDNSPSPHIKDILTAYAQKDERIKVVFREENGHISAASNSALELATGEFIALLDHDDLLTPDALYEIAYLLNQHPEADMIYSDEDKVNEQNQLQDPYFKPDWCPDSFLSRMYICHLGTYRRSIINQIGGFRIGYEGSQDYDLVLRFTEQTKTEKIFHIPKILYHWRIHAASTAMADEVKPYCYDAGEQALQEALVRRGEPGRAIRNLRFPGVYTVRYDILDYKKVSIIIPTRNYGNVLDKCLRSIFYRSSYANFEVIVIDNGSDEAETLALFDTWKQKEPDKFKCYRLDIPFNYSRLNNYGVSKAKGDYLLFLNNDTETITPDWIEAMVEQVQRPSVGAVGAKLLYFDDTMQHAGVIMGLGGVAGHSHKNYEANHPGYVRQLIGVSNYSAITAACLMCRREVYEQVSGFEEHLQVAFNDVDFCLKIQQQGYHNVLLPHVVLYHYESKSRGYEDTPEKQQRFQQEIEYIKNKWREIIAHDPCYSPNLTREREDYSLNIQTRIEVLDVIDAELDSEKLWGFHIDTPQPGEIVQGLLTISGWVVGKQSPASKVEIISEGKVLGTANVDQARSDVAQIFSHVSEAKYSGFSVTINLLDVAKEAGILLKVAFADGSFTKLGKLKLRY